MMRGQNILASFDMPPDVGIDEKVAGFVEHSAYEKGAEHCREGEDPLQKIRPRKGLLYELPFGGLRTGGPRWKA
jgi:hypothetical protein